MKKLIFKKFISDYLSFLIIATLSASIIIWVFQAVNYLDIIVEDGRDYFTYSLYSFLTFPKIFSKILPFGIFFSFYHIITKYETNNELLIFWTFGVNKIDFVNLVLKFSFYLLLVQLILTSFIVPKTQDMARSVLRSSDINFFGSLIKEKKFNDLISGITIHAENKNNQGEFENVYLKKNLDINNFEVTFAKKGQVEILDNNQFLILYNGQNIRSIENVITTFKFSESRINLAQFDTNIMKIIKTQENSTYELIKCFLNLKEKKFQTIEPKNQKEVQNCSAQNLKKIFEETYKRIIIPIYIPILALISLFLIITSKEKINYSKYKLLIFLTGIFFIILSETTLRFIQDNIEKNIILILIPFLILILFYIFFLNKFNKKVIEFR